MPSPSNAGSVEVQAPPGLEAVNGLRCGPSPLITSGSSGAGSIGPIAPPKAELKDELVREVTAAVRDHIECKTAEAVDTLWQKGQRAMQHLQQQQLNQTAQLQSQLVACAEAHAQLQRENRMLRTGLEALMKHLTLVFGPPPHMPGMPPSAPPVTPPPGSAPAFFPPGAPPASAVAAAAAASGAQQATETSQSSQSGAAPHAAPPPQPKAESQAANLGNGEIHTEDFHTPAGSPLRASTAAEDLLPGPSSSGTQSALPGLPGFPVGPSSCGGTGSNPTSPSPLSSAQQSPANTTAPAFSLTLRRADNVSLGLDVVREPDQEWLLVEGIRPGGAVEAWNRQCHGDAREIRPGDHIVMINGSRDAEAMQEECLQKHLLRMSVVRGSTRHGATGSAPEAAAQASPAGSGGNTATPASSQGHGGLRAEADEFVPGQAAARSWGLYPSGIAASS